MMSQAISNTGDWLIIGILMVLVNQLSGAGQTSTLAISGLWIAKMLPIIFYPVVGALVDMVDRKKGMITSDLVRGLLIVMVPFIVGLNSIFLLYVIIFLSELFTLFFVPAKDSSIPNLVKRDEILDANSISFSINQATMFIGLALGTTIVFTVNKIFEKVPILKGFAGVYSAVYVDALTFFISAFILLFIAFPKAEKKIGEDYKKFIDNIKESFIYLAENKKIRWLIVSVSFSILGMGTILMVGPDYAKNTLKAGEAGFLPLLTFLSLGLLTGAISVGWVSSRVSKEIIFASSLSVLGVCLVLFASIPEFTFAIFLSIIIGICLGGLYVSAYTIMHENISDEIRGRLFTTLEADLRLAVILSALITGFTDRIIRILTVDGDILGISTPRIILFIGGAIVVLVAIYSVKYVLRSIHLHGQTETSS